MTDIEEEDVLPELEDDGNINDVDIDVEPNEPPDHYTCAHCRNRRRLASYQGEGNQEVMLCYNCATLHMAARELRGIRERFTFEERTAIHEDF